jgi:hypothetical protein
MCNSNVSQVIAIKVTAKKSSHTCHCVILKLYKNTAFKDAACFPRSFSTHQFQYLKVKGANFALAPKIFLSAMSELLTIMITQT